MAKPLLIGDYPVSTVASALATMSFFGALATDVTYWQTSDIQWANFSAWLLSIGMMLGGLCIIIELTYLLRDHGRYRSISGLWFAVMTVALAIALTNNFIHARDGWTSVVPSGLILSAITFVLMIVSSAMIPNRARIGELS